MAEIEGSTGTNFVQAFISEVKKKRPCGEGGCGEWRGGSMYLCATCEAFYENMYPQGWRGYPGDTCRHGRYTGGSGVDWTCGPCEMGDD